jgi:ribonuclease HI
MPRQNKIIPRVSLFTDGSCVPNPGRGGWAFVLRHDATGQEKEGSGFEARTTCNRMELEGVIRGLSSLLESCQVEVVTDSEYVCKVGRACGAWKRNGWKRSHRQGKQPKNVDLLEQLHPLLLAHDVRFTWVRGHDGHPENERCDALAAEAMKNGVHRRTSAVPCTA